MKLDPYGRKRGESLVALLAGKVGFVADIRLRRLIRVARELKGSGGLTLTTRLYEFVGPDTHVVRLPAGASARRERSARRIVKVKPGRRREEKLRRYLDDLEEEAVDAIRTGAPAAFDSVAEAYVETLMEFPRSWERYGQAYSAAVAQGTELFPVGPVDTIRQQLYNNVKEAVQAGSDNVLLAAAYVPIRVCTRALRHQADGLLTKMISLSTALVMVGWTQGGNQGNLLADCVPRHLVDFTRFNLQPALDEGEVADRLRHGGYVRQVYDQFAEMLKLAVERGDLAFIRRVDSDWDTLLENWQVDPLAAHSTVIRGLQEAVERENARAARRLQQAQENAKLARLSKELMVRRTILRFGLVLWAWRQIPEAWQESFTYFSSQLGGVPDLARVATLAIEAERTDRSFDTVPWLNWILSSKQTGRVHRIAGAEGVVETFIAAALRAVDPEAETPQLTPAEWMQTRLDYARKVLDDSVTDVRNVDLPDVAARAAKVQEALEAGADEWKQKERFTIIEAPLVPEKLASFREGVRESLRTQRIVPDLLRLADATRALDAPPDDRKVMQAQTPKALFIQDSRFLGAEMIASDLARQVARAEERALIEPMASASPMALDSGDPGADDAATFRERFRLLVEHAVEDHGSKSVALFLPLTWQLSEALGLPVLGGAAPPPDEWGFSQGATNAFSGLFAGAPAYHIPEVPKDRLYVVNLSKYVTAETWQLNEAAAVTVEVPDEEKARTYAQADPGKEKLGEEEIVRRWRETAIVTVDPGLRIPTERDDSALTAVALPASLQRGGL